MATTKNLEKDVFGTCIEETAVEDCENAEVSEREAMDSEGPTKEDNYGENDKEDVEDKDDFKNEGAAKYVLETSESVHNIQNVRFHQLGIPLCLHTGHDLDSVASELLGADVTWLLNDVLICSSLTFKYKVLRKIVMSNWWSIEHNTCFYLDFGSVLKTISPHTAGDPAHSCDMMNLLEF
ncbi:hypothetical protein FNV43_RR04462 [Rhamnella rubrinervis]|uniref:Uncharacterized protein n=1 Tax=Rhamnella rubrinervis TaxID=2594499 RepID=A0A8K0HLZ1_9ROSA|nr:hypothetical protein FNV43_RR04462 [Rhamnella rubrinervis]